MKDRTPLLNESDREGQDGPSDYHVVRLSTHQYYVRNVFVLFAVAIVFFTIGSFVAFGSHH